MSWLWGGMLVAVVVAALSYWLLRLQAVRADVARARGASR